MLRGRVLVLALCLASSALSAGCDAAVENEFPDGMEPLDEVNKAPLPEPEAGEAHPERVNVVIGLDDDWEWAHGRGYVHAPIARVWEALRNPDVCVDRREVHEWTVEHDVEEGFDVSFRIQNTVYSFATVHFESTWRQSVAEGTPDDPSIVLVRGQKTAGTSYITLLADSVVALEVSAGVTELQFIRHISALAAGRREAEVFIGDFYESIRAAAKGEPLPTY